VTLRRVDAPLKLKGARGGAIAELGEARAGRPSTQERAGSRPSSPGTGATNGEATSCAAVRISVDEVGLVI